MTQELNKSKILKQIVEELSALSDEEFQKIVQSHDVKALAEIFNRMNLADFNSGDQEDGQKL